MLVFLVRQVEVRCRLTGSEHAAMLPIW
jgi:hypothetical protein